MMTRFNISRTWNLISHCVFKQRGKLRISINSGDNYELQSFTGFCSSSSQSVLYEKQGSIATIGINRIESRNSIDRTVVERLNERIRELESDPEIAVGVLYGVGGSFSSGYDLAEIQKDGFSGHLQNKVWLYLYLFLISNSNFLLQFPSRRIIRKPLICAVNGYCLGSGFELALMCDLRVIEDSAVMGFYNRRFGIPIIDGGTARLPAMVGLSRALDLVLTGRAITGKEALEMGLACRLVATGTSLGQAINVAVQVAKFPQLAVLHDRDSVYKASMGSSESFDEFVTEQHEKLPENIDQICREGAERFLQENIGKGGKFYDIKKKAISDWEQEEIDLEKKERK